MIWFDSMEPRDLLPDDSKAPGQAQWHARLKYIFDIRHRVVAWLLCEILGHNDAMERGKCFRWTQMILINYSTGMLGIGHWGVPPTTTQTIVNYFTIDICYEICMHPQMRRVCNIAGDTHGASIMMKVFGKPGTKDGGQHFVRLTPWIKWLTSIMNDEPSQRDVRPIFLHCICAYDVSDHV